MDDRQRTSISTFLDLILRHSPQTVGFSLDSHDSVD